MAVITNKLISALAILLVAMPALAARPTCILGIDQDYGNSSQLSLVLDEITKLPETPSRMPAALGSPNRCPLPDALQVFEGYSRSGAFSQRDKLFRDAVILVPTEICLPSADFHEMPFCGFGATTLEVGTERSIPFPARLNSVPRMGISSAIHSDVLDAKIHTDYVLRLDRSSIWKLNGHVKKELLVTINQIGLALPGAGHGLLVRAHHKRNPDSIVSRGNTYGLKAFDTQYSVVIDDGGIFLELGLDLLVSFIYAHGLTNGTYGELRRQVELGSQFEVAPLMDRGLGKDLVSESYFCSVSGCLIEFLECIEKGGLLLFIRQYSYLRRELHDGSIGGGRS